MSGLARARRIVLVPVLVVLGIAVLLVVKAVRDHCEAGGCVPGSTRHYVAPDPGGSERARLPVPPPRGKLFGWNSQSWLVPALGVSPARDADWAAGTGANAHRLPFDWRYAEPQPGQFATGPGGFVRLFDELYRRLLRDHIRPVILLSSAPAWARAPGAAQACGQASQCQYPPDPARPEVWRRVVRFLATRYPDADLEVWNEPNLTIFWLPKPDPGAFARLLAQAYDEVKAVNPRMRVIAGGINGNLCDSCGQGLSAKTFLKRAYASRWAPARHMDALSFHAYPAMKHGDIEGLGRNTSFAAQWKGLRDALRAAHDAGRRIWVTETGATRSGPGGASPETQFRALRRIYDKTLTMRGVDAVFFFTLVELPTFPAGSPERGYGVSTGAGGGELAPLPAWCGFANLARRHTGPGCG